MSTYREIAYLVLDEIKGMSDDFVYNEDHVMFLTNKYRAFLIKQQYKNIKKEVPRRYYQEICVNLEQYNPTGLECGGSIYLRSKEKLPYSVFIDPPQVTPIDFYSQEIAFVSQARLRYVGYNKYLKNIIYASVGSDYHLYLKSSNPQFLELEKIKVYDVFEDPKEADKYSCSSTADCTDDLDLTVPIEDSMITTLVQLIVKDLSGAKYQPEDGTNNDSDDTGDLSRYMSINTKNDLQKKLQLQGQ